LINFVDRSQRANHYARPPDRISNWTAVTVWYRLAGVYLMPYLCRTYIDLLHSHVHRTHCACGLLHAVDSTIT